MSKIGSILKALLLVGAVCAAYYAYELGWGFRLQGGLALFCYELMDFNYDHGGSVTLAYPLVAGRWVEACQAAYESLGPHQKNYVKYFLGAPISPGILYPPGQLFRWGHGPNPINQEDKEQARAKLLADPPRHRAAPGPSREELLQRILELSGDPGLDWMHMHAAQWEAFGSPAQEPVVEPSEVSTALKEGRLVRFDATKVLPPHVFNVTLDRLAELHAPHGDDISILAFLHESKQCRERAYARRKRNPVGALFCPKPPTLGGTRRSFPDPKQMPNSARIALKRLPNYVNEDDMLRKLSIEGWERAEGQIIMGHANGDTHWDEQDNIFVQVSGVSVVFAVDAEYSNAIGGDEKWSFKSSGLTVFEWLYSDEVRKTAIPWYYMVLGPGDAIAIPSRAFHAVYGAHNRASIQTFLEPTFQGMRFGTNKNSYWYMESDLRQALRNLYFKTLARLWETRGMGLVAQGGIIEYL